MKKDDTLARAIDDSLRGVRFNEEDMLSVLNQTTRKNRTSSKHSTLRPAPEKRPRYRPGAALALAACLALLAPLSLLGLRGIGMPEFFPAAPGVTRVPQVSNLPLTAAGPAATGSPATTTKPASFLDDAQAIELARKYFEANCDTSVFSFDEYAVSVSPGNTPEICLVTLRCIYENGRIFVVTLDARTGDVLALAAKPVAVDMQSPQVRSWFDRYGESMEDWPEEAQAEFRRRYEGL